MSSNISPSDQDHSRPPHWLRTLGLTAFAMLAFAGNSVLCRLALKDETIDPAGYTLVRLIAGAVLLALRRNGSVYLRSDPVIRLHQH